MNRVSRVETVTCRRCGGNAVAMALARAPYGCEGEWDGESIS